MRQTNTSDYYIHFENVDYYLDLSKHIAYYRRKFGMTQEELAEKAHISRSYLSHIESPNAPQKCSLDTLFKICHALEIQPVDLFIPLP